MIPHERLKSLLEDHGIRYVEEGPNTRRGEVSIKCPMCGNADPSEHMGIDPKTGYWACWRNAKHRGRDLPRLFTQLFGCSLQEARELLKQPNLGTGFTQQFNSIMNRHEHVEDDEKEIAQWPGEFRKLNDGVLGKKYFRYLMSRGFNDTEAHEIINRYDLRYAVKGKWTNRILIPTHLYQPSVVALPKVASWTGRAISESIQPKYKAFSGQCNDADGNIKLRVFGAWRYKNTETMCFITEGPLDAIKLDFFGETQYYGAFGGIAIFGLTATNYQQAILTSLAHRGVTLLSLLDPTALAQNMQLCEQLSHVGAKRAKWPFDVTRDPGDLSEKEIHELIRVNLDG